MLGARIGGQFNCRGGRFDNPKRTALVLERAQSEALLLRGPQSPSSPQYLSCLEHEVSTQADDPADLDGQEVTLHLDGFADQRSAPSPRGSLQDANSRLQCLERQPRGHYYPQPYDQLAAVFLRQWSGLRSQERTDRKAPQASKSASSRLAEWVAPQILGLVSGLFGAVRMAAVAAAFGRRGSLPARIRADFLHMGRTSLSSPFLTIAWPHDSFIHTLDVFLTISRSGRRIELDYRNSQRSARSTGS